MLRFPLLILAVISTALATAKEPPIPADLGQYLEKPETTAGWETKTNGRIANCKYKRGWTAWLAAAADPRVAALAPMVIDLLNIPAQLPRQLDRFGAPSNMISPYTDRGLVPLQDTDEARALWRMADPWSYRSKLTMPRLVVLANNDPYWTTDALNVYWNDLPGQKHISYTPNAGHNLSEVQAGGQSTPPWRAVNNIAAFVRSQIAGKPVPEISWEHDDAPDGELRWKRGAPRGTALFPRSHRLLLPSQEGQKSQPAEQDRGRFGNHHQ